MPEVAGDAARLVNPKSTKEISGALRRIITSKNLKNQLINKGFAQITNSSGKSVLLTD
jgi:hypothetical protein